MGGKRQPYMHFGQPLSSNIKAKRSRRDKTQLTDLYFARSVCMPIHSHSHSWHAAPHASLRRELSKFRRTKLQRPADLTPIPRAVLTKRSLVTSCASHAKHAAMLSPPDARELRSLVPGRMCRSAVVRGCGTRREGVRPLLAVLASKRPIQARVHLSKAAGWEADQPFANVATMAAPMPPKDGRQAITTPPCLRSGRQLVSMRWLQQWRWPSRSIGPNPSPSDTGHHWPFCMLHSVSPVSPSSPPSPVCHPFAGPILPISPVHQLPALPPTSHIKVVDPHC
ncbi:hypothetical protein B0I35DRAFT_99736 [Stachybotrys elegans]|uniref:Uncharacterized protein n=1 Tax=Stachybotrys elegans TaxID=80388 RepID=A0A8K0WL83_9HYPO|nr:hypothetical protein B0I35DRAFT_99736 [Stachybotrys elegans]